MSEQERFRIAEDESSLTIEWGLVLAFRRRDDRWTHTIQGARRPPSKLPAADNPLSGLISAEYDKTYRLWYEVHSHGARITSLVGVSYEWDSTRDDPDRVFSPVFQELQLHHDRDGRPHVLLLGMSGPHHFSADFSCEDREGESRLSVDVADRCRRAEASFRASTYDMMLDSSQLVEADSSMIAWDHGDRRLAFEAGPSTSLAMAEAGRRATRVQALAEIGVAGATRRWQYSWSLSPPSPE